MSRPSFSPVLPICWLAVLLIAAFPAFPQPQDPKRSPNELSAATNNNLAITRAALGRDFLLSASVISQSGAPTSRGLAGKVVRFELYHDGVDLYENVDGIVVTKDLPARRLIATFPIVEQNANQIVIDFNKGMNRVFTDSWIGGDGGGPSDRVLEVPQSRVFAIDRTDEYLAIRQSVQARDREFDSNREGRYEIRYFISPYTAQDKPGKEQPENDTRYVRFFETAPLLELTSGRRSAKMARFDLSKPVQFYYSANTPKDYVDAVKEGILYWNRAFGKEVVKADKAPEGVTAPDARYNIVQWVPWDSAGFAYADILLDPLNGESKHGQAYITSVFAIGGRARARSTLRAMIDLAGGGEKKAEKKDGDPKKLTASPFGSFFFGTETACQVDVPAYAAEVAKGLQDLLANDQLTDEAVLRASQDYVRHTVAHEVGHVLGLRHNFAGSLGATLTHQDLDDWFKAYLVNTNLESYTNKVGSSSVMEYSVFKARVFDGWKIRTLKDALPYDKAAIQWGYFDSKEPVEKKMLFGTDGDAYRYSDVAPFDYGPDPVVGAYGDLAALIRNLPNSIIETYISARAPRDPRDRIPLERVNISVRGYAASAANDFAAMLTSFRANVRSLRVENQFDFIGDLNQKERYQAHWASLTNQIDRLGGIDRALFGFIPVDLKLDLKDEPKGVELAEKINPTALTTRLEKLLEAPSYTNFVGLDEKKYSFTKEEKELIVKRGKKFFEEFEKEVVKQVCHRLEDAPRNLGLEANGVVNEEDAVAKLEKRIVDLARTVVLATEDDKLLKGKVNDAITEVVEFKYDDDTRLAAAKALNDKTGSYRGWATDAKGDLNKALKDKVDGALGIPNLKEFKDSNLSRSLREWYLKQQDILALLPPKPGAR